MTIADQIARPVSVPPPSLLHRQAGSTGVPYVHELDSGESGPDVLLTALVHGNEYSGAIVLDEFLETGLMPSRGRFTVAFCNVAAFDRFDPATPDASRFVDEDFNRVWSPQRLDGRDDSTELRRARALRPFVERCTHLLDFHSMHEPCPPLMVTGTLPRNIEFARHLRSGAQSVIDEGHAEGVRMRDYEGRGYPGDARIALLLEAGQHWEPGAVATARDVLMRFLVKSGSLAASDVPAGWLLPDASPQGAIRVTHRVAARSVDFRFAQHFSGGEVISRAGTVIATDAGEPVTTPYDDCVLVMPSVRQLRPGVTTVRLGCRVSDG